MLTPFLIQVIAGGVGVILLMVLGRRLWRNRQAKVNAQASQVEQTVPQMVPEQPPEAPASPRPLSPRSLSPRSLYPATFQPKIGKNRALNDALPRLEPGDFPNADTSDYVLGPITRLLAEMLPESATRLEEVKSELRSAGFYSPHSLQNLQAIRYSLILAALLGFGILMMVTPPRFEFMVVITMPTLAILGWALPRLYVRSKANERRLEIERSMPDVLDMLNMCVSQGMTLLPAMHRVNRELSHVYPALSQELQIVAEQSQIGTLEHALKNFAERVDVPDVHSFTNLLIQTERMGTSVSIALHEYAENMREHLRQRADEKANQATYKLLFPTVLCLMPAVYMFLLGPSIIELSDFFYGDSQQLDQATGALQDFNNR